MDGTIVSYRRGRHVQKCNHIIVSIDEVETREDALKLVGKETKYVSSGKNKVEIAGKVAAAHGNKGAVRVVFDRGLPGQALGTKLSL